MGESGDGGREVMCGCQGSGMRETKGERKGRRGNGSCKMDEEEEEKEEGKKRE